MDGRYCFEGEGWGSRGCLRAPCTPYEGIVLNTRRCVDHGRPERVHVFESPASPSRGVAQRHAPDHEKEGNDIPRKHHGTACPLALASIKPTRGRREHGHKGTSSRLLWSVAREAEDVRVLSRLSSWTKGGFKYHKIADDLWKAGDEAA